MEHTPPFSGRSPLPMDLASTGLGHLNAHGSHSHVDVRSDDIRAPGTVGLPASTHPLINSSLLPLSGTPRPFPFALNSIPTSHFEGIPTSASNFHRPISVHTVRERPIAHTSFPSRPQSAVTLPTHHALSHMTTPDQNAFSPCLPVSSQATLSYVSTPTIAPSLSRSSHFVPSHFRAMTLSSHTRSVSPVHLSPPPLLLPNQQAIYYSPPHIAQPQPFYPFQPPLVHSPPPFSTPPSHSLLSPRLGSTMHPLVPHVHHTPHDLGPEPYARVLPSVHSPPPSTLLSPIDINAHYNPLYRHTPTPLLHSHYTPVQSIHSHRSQASPFPSHASPAHFLNHDQPQQLAPIIIPSSSRPSLPSTKEIPLLTGTADWGPWNAQVKNTIIHSNVFSHIAEEPLPGSTYDPGLMPSHPPIVTPDSSRTELETFERWWSDDGVASHVLISRLSPSVLASVPELNERFGQRRSARFIYNTLQNLYGCGDYAAAAIVEEKLRVLSCTSAAFVPKYVSQWRTSVNQMQTAGHLPPMRKLLQMFADGLPTMVVSYTNLHDIIMTSLNGPDNNLPTLLDVFERSSQIAKDQERHKIRTSTTSSGCNTTRTSNSSTDATSNGQKGSTPPSSTSPSPNSSSSGTMPRAAPRGGGKEGQGRRDERPRPQANLASIKEVPEEARPPDPNPPPSAPSAAFAAMSVTSTNDIDFESYMMPEAYELSELLNKESFLATMSTQFSTILNSGCTNHIIRDRHFFWTYHADESISIRTANCGSLAALGRGDVHVQFMVGDRKITWRLRNCLHAPEVPINLISVGALQESGMTISFAQDSTILSFPLMSKLEGVRFPALVSQRLSFLDLQFLEPSPKPIEDDCYTAFPSFPDAALTPDLWHRRLGHPGLDTTRNVLTKSYATGVVWKGTISREHCIPCLVGKSPQIPYSNKGNRAENVCDLIHMDTCGPYPVQTPHKERYFVIMLDDKSNYGNTTLLVRKNDVFVAWKHVTASWELLTGNKVRAVRLDGAKEFVEGALGDHLRNAGITMQITAPYAHPQAGKAERYVQTIADTAQSLLADAKLPPSLWGRAVQTAQYLRNRLPTKTLSGKVTPHEVLTGKKPDLSHLRIWGCQCFVNIPVELREKGGPHRYEAVFVGYEEDRVGWWVRKIDGSFAFSRDIVFNENIPGHLSPRRKALPYPSPSLEPLSSTTAPRVLRSHVKHAALAQVILDRDERIGDDIQLAHPYRSIETIDAFVAFNRSALLVLDGDATTITDFPDSGYFLHDHVFDPSRYRPRFRPRQYDLTRPPESYDEAISRPDKEKWVTAMNREKESLLQRKAFVVASLPPGRKAIGVRWVYDYKYNTDGKIIDGKEKARLVAQGFSQRPEDFNNTYAPVAKLTSDRILLAFATFHDLDIFCFDIKTAFLHAKLQTTIFIKQIPGSSGKLYLYN